MFPIILKPTEKSLIWGTEQWGISAHPSGDNKVLNTEYEGLTLSELWEKYPELFGVASNPKKAFPLLTKIIDAKSDLSIQVHPDDKYAFENENGSYGKTECWYIMDALPGTKIVIGHNAKNKDELVNMIQEGKWSSFIREVPVKKGDFFFIEPGTVHAIKGGTVILETQQSSDITYRVYDYDRLQDGKPRPLHVKQSIDVINAPFVQKEPPLNAEKSISKDSSVRQLASCPLFSVWHAKVDGELILSQQKSFLLISVIEGSVCVSGMEFVKSGHFIVPAGNEDFTIQGNAELIISSI